MTKSSPYNIVFANAVKKQVKKIPHKDHDAIQQDLNKVAEDPYKLSEKVGNPNLPARKTRKGNYRALFDIDNEMHTLYVKSILHRSKVYTVK